MELSDQQKRELSEYAGEIEYAMQMGGSEGRCGGLATQWPTLIREAVESGDFASLQKKAIEEERRDIARKISSILRQKGKKRRK